MAKFLFPWDTGRTVYLTVRIPAGTIWNGSAFVTYATVDYANYDVAMTEQGTASGWYQVDIPSFPAGTIGPYIVSAHQQAGGTPVETDTKIGAARLSDLEMEDIVETGVSEKGAVRAIGSATAGKSSGGPANSIFQSMGGSTTRLTTVADEDGNRTTVTLNV